MIRALSLTAVLSLSMLLTGCNNDPEGLLKNMVSKLDEVTAVLQGVTDQASAKAAAPKVKTLLDEYGAMVEKSKTTRTNASEQTRLETTYKPLLFNAGKRLGEQYGRILMDSKSQTPELMAALEGIKKMK